MMCPASAKQECNAACRRAAHLVPLCPSCARSSGELTGCNYAEGAPSLVSRQWRSLPMMHGRMDGRASFIRRKDIQVGSPSILNQVPET